MIETCALTLDTADGPMLLHVAEPPDRARRAVIVLQEAFGVNDHIQHVTVRCASAGYYAVAPEIFHRTGERGTAEYGDLDAVMLLLDGLTDEDVLVDLDATFRHLDSLGYDAEHVGMVGFCMGGRLTFMAAIRRSFGAAVTFYGGGIVEPGRLPFPTLIDQATRLQTPWLGLYGGRDPSVPNEQVDRLEIALKAVGVPAHDLIRYPDAGHGFNNDARPDHHHPAAAADAWSRMLLWFDQRLP